MPLKPLLLKQLEVTKDPSQIISYIRENFRRLEEAYGDLGTGAGDTINNITNLLQGEWVRDNTSVAASTTETVDTVALADFFGLKYIVTYSNDANSLTKKLELSIIKVGSTVSDTVSNRIGSGDVAIDVVVVGSNVEIQVTNNEAFQVDVEFIKTNL